MLDGPKVIQPNSSSLGPVSPGTLPQQRVSVLQKLGYTQFDPSQIKSSLKTKCKVMQGFEQVLVPIAELICPGERFPGGRGDEEGDGEGDGAVD